jgi:hypothetical protein
MTSREERGCFANGLARHEAGPFHPPSAGAGRKIARTLALAAAGFISTRGLAFEGGVKGLRLGEDWKDRSFEEVMAALRGPEPEICKRHEKVIRRLKNGRRRQSKEMTRAALVEAYVNLAYDCPGRWDALLSANSKRSLDPGIRVAVDERLAADREELEARRRRAAQWDREVYANGSALPPAKPEVVSLGSTGSQGICASVVLDGARRPIGTTCDPKDQSNDRCTDLLCLRGKIEYRGLEAVGGGLVRGWPSTRVDGDVAHWRRDRWRENACHLSVNISGSMHGGSDGTGFQYASDSELVAAVEAEMTKCLQKIRQESP